MRCEPTLINRRETIQIIPVTLALASDILAAESSDGDLQMSDWTASSRGARLGLIVHHADAARKFAYDRDSRVGKLDRGLDACKDKGWVVMDIE